MARIRSTRSIAKRIDLDYFMKSHPFRSWKRNLSWAAVFIALAWPSVSALRGDSTPYSAGPMSSRHAMFAAQCSSCHKGPWADRYLHPEQWQARLDDACLACHDGPMHHGNQTDFLRGLSSSRCSACHAEHRGNAQLADLKAGHCTQCHANLETRGPEPHSGRCLMGAKHAIAHSIHGFDEDHPPFALQAQNFKDPTRLKYNHVVHLNPDSDKKREQLQADLKRLGPRPEIVHDRTGQAFLACGFCHEPDGARQYMKPVHYEAHCRECHALEFRDDYNNEPAARIPHEAPSVVRNFFRSRLGGHIADPDALADKVSELETSVFTMGQTTCLKCHDVELADNSIENPPTVHPTGIHAGDSGYEGSPRRWFAHSVFNHAAHRELTCLQCHGAAERSTKTTDVLMPAKTLCVSCHSDAGGAPTTCVTCHTFHDQTRGRGFEGKLKIDRVRR